MPEHPYLQWPVFRRSVVAAFQRSPNTDLDAALPKLGKAVTVFAGQFCMTGSRVLVRIPRIVITWSTPS